MAMAPRKPARRRRGKAAAASCDEVSWLGLAEIGNAARGEVLHRRVDRDMGDASAAIDPAIAVEPRLLLRSEVLEIGLRIELQHRRRRLDVQHAADIAQRAGI